ncbi:MAG: DEAD/DEAH box helicase family protein [Myxococcales bacterium]|nr:DEAD/DEAH box helicase family protein [Myxococcales bacterium]
MLPARPEVPYMKSQNFEFVRSRRAVLADLGGFAESYAHTDPASSLIKQRSIVEQVVNSIFDVYRLRAPYSDNLNDMMNEHEFRDAVPEVVQGKLHAVRKAGNMAAHPRRPSGGRPAPQLTPQLALERLQQTFEIVLWFHIQVDGGQRKDCPIYDPPAAGTSTSGKARETLEKLRLAEAKFEAVLAEVEDERKKRLAAEQVAAATAAELAELRTQGQQVAATLEFNELTTRRRLIDTMLLDADWDVGVDGASTETVKQEVDLGPGKGRADYVLYGPNGKPLAVIEAKRTVKDAKAGAEQARLYADALEEATGQRPVIFCTNGMDLYLDDDAQKYPRRKVYGFYSLDSLEYLVHQRSAKSNLATVAPNLTITERMYQLEAIKRVTERFSSKFRKTLIVQATGTGKTRVAVSLCDVLMRAGWAKRILFLCDRRELRRQADRVFKEFMPGEPRVVVDSTTSNDRDKRIYLATYPAMMQCYEGFDVGFFDLIIADESHRSIYKKFRSLFQYFDALEVGLTATPVNFVERDTYKLFECEDRDPTSHFSFQEAISSSPPYLSPFRVREFSTWARTDGFSYQGMNDEQKRQLEDQTSTPDDIDFAPEDLDLKLFNADSTRHVWRTLMEEGIRDATGSRIGKTIVFARRHEHAVHMAEIFSQLYPQYGSAFCKIIDNRETRCEQLIDDFKNPADDLTIAISVDMLDTGIDVPEVVNLVFAKPVKSYVKFWQMIGRGTRLCRDLFGPGRDKTEFLIFDHWGNFRFFDEGFEEKQPSVQKSLLQHLFEARVELAQAALDKLDQPAFEQTAALLILDINAARTANSIEVRDRWRELELLSEGDRIAHFASATKADLLDIAAPLQQWRSIRGDEDAYRFDLLMTRLQVELMKGGPKAPRVQDLRARVQEAVELLAKNQNPVKAHADAINQVRDKDFWTNVQVHQVEGLRNDLRGIMKHQQSTPTGRVAPLVFDVTDTDLHAATYVPKLEGLDLVAYRQRVETVLQQHFAQNPVLQRLRDGQAVPEPELEELARLVLQIDDRANIRHLVGRQPEPRRSLVTVFRSLVGLEPGAVARAFADFVHKYPAMSSQQLRFLQLLQNYIAQNGGIDIDRLYEPPFTTVHTDSVDGLFPDPAQAGEVFAILEAFQSPAENVQ